MNNSDNIQTTENSKPNNPGYETIFCSTCGAKIAKTAVACPHCGAPVAQNQQQPQIVINNSNANSNVNNNNIGGRNNGREKNKWVAFLLCFFLGYVGAHKFYEGRIGMGILYLFTMGLFGIGWFVDTIAILTKPNPYYV